jgi:hypothetical protein
MYKIDGPDAVPAKPAKKPAASQPGWFQGGDPTTNLSATMMTYNWANMIQDEGLGLLEAAGMQPDRNDDKQWAKAVLALINNKISQMVPQIINQIVPDMIDNKIAEIPEPEPPVIPDIPDAVPVGMILPFYGTSAPTGYFKCDGSPFSAVNYPRLYAVLGERSTTPDLSGLFLRGLGGSALGLGVKQEDMGRGATGWFLADDSQRGVGGETPVGAAYGGVFAPGETIVGYDINHKNNTPNLGGFLTFDLARAWGAAHAGNEFRPVNMAILYCIKHD